MHGGFFFFKVWSRLDTRGETDGARCGRRSCSSPQTSADLDKQGNSAKGTPPGNKSRNSTRNLKRTQTRSWGRNDFGFSCDSVPGIAQQPFHAQVQKSTFSQPFKEKCISDVVRIDSIIIFHLSKLWKVKFFILCDVTFLVRLQEKFEIDYSWWWKG